MTRRAFDTRPQQVSRLRTSAGSAFDGAIVGSTAVLFPVERGVADDVRLQVPSGVAKIIVTGLRPGAGYTSTYDGGELRVRPGGSQQTDAACVLEINV